MKDDIQNIDDLNEIMQDALFKLQKLVNKNQSQQPDFIKVVKTFLLGVFSTAIDLVEIQRPGSSLFLYGDIEAAAKLGGMREILKWSTSHGHAHYSVSNIDPDDKVTAMNYIGQQLGATLFKALHELPLPLRDEEMMLRGAEALLGNLLDQKFRQYNPHQILDNLCEHVHMVLKDLESRSKH